MLWKSFPRKMTYYAGSNLLQVPMCVSSEQINQLLERLKTEEISGIRSPPRKVMVPFVQQHVSGRNLPQQVNKGPYVQS